MSLRETLEQERERERPDAVSGLLSFSARGRYFRGPSKFADSVQSTLGKRGKR